MTRITLDLLRKRCEHNDGIIHSMEELSLHQDNLEEIDNIGRWCKDLKILYLQGNTIQKIENLNRLKALEYLNLALNSVERVENLEGCEALQKLDLTANFIGDLTSVENLRQNVCLEQLFLTGNPCAGYDGYRQYVIAALPHLKVLDGQEITRTERLLALQEFLDIKGRIIKQQNQHKAKRDTERALNEELLSTGTLSIAEVEALPWSPESRRFAARLRAQQLHDADAAKTKSRKCLASSQNGPERPVKLFNASGEALNVNQARLDFQLQEEDDQFVLDVAVYRFFPWVGAQYPQQQIDRITNRPLPICWSKPKPGPHLDSSLINVDVQPSFVKVEIKGKVLQLRLAEDIIVGRSTVQRSKTTGHLVVSLPKVGTMQKDQSLEHPSKSSKSTGMPRVDKDKTPTDAGETAVSRPFLDVPASTERAISLRILANRSASHGCTAVSARPNSANFLDDSDVPPLS